MTRSDNWLDAGQAITCDSGHTIARATARVETGTGDWIERMAWAQPVPKHGEPAECAICGCLWLLNYTTGSVPLQTRRTWLCVDGEWGARELTDEAREYLATYRGFRA